MEQCHTGGRAVVLVIVAEYRDFALMQQFYKLYLGPVESNLKKEDVCLFVLFFASN